MRHRPRRGLIAILGALSLAAPLVATSPSAAPAIGAAFTDAAQTEASVVGTASLPPLTEATATRGAGGAATLSWSAPTGLGDRDVTYSLERTVGSQTTTLAPVSGTSLTDNLTTVARFEARLVTHLSLGSFHTCVLAGGAPHCWGRSEVGQLGNGATTSSWRPQPVDRSGVLAGKTITALDSGPWHTCVIADGAPYCWGFNLYGSLGMGPGTVNNPRFSSTPVAVDTSGVLRGKTVTHLSAGLNFTCVIADSAPYCWGEQYRGSLGHGDTEDHDNKPWPVAVHLPAQLQGKTFIDVTAGGSHACARTSDRMAYCWGNNGVGQLGIGSSAGATPHPFRVRASTNSADGYLEDVFSISAGVLSTCANARKPSDTRHKLYCWGGYLNSTTRDPGTAGSGYATTSAPREIDISGIPQLANGINWVTAGNVSCAIPTVPQAAYCWGEGLGGQLGDGARLDRLTPVAVGFIHAGYLTAIDHGVAHGCALKANQVLCWGTSADGALGMNEAQRLIPTAVPTDNPSLGSARCTTGWTLVAGERCAPGQDIPVSYRVGYTAEGWSPPSTLSVTVQWQGTP